MNAVSHFLPNLLNKYTFCLPSSSNTHLKHLKTLNIFFFTILILTLTKSNLSTKYFKAEHDFPWLFQLIKSLNMKFRIYLWKCQNSKWGFPYVHVIAFWRELKLITCCTWKRQTCYCLFVMTTALFYSMAHTTNKSDFSFFSPSPPPSLSLTNTVLVSRWRSRCDSDILTVCSTTGGQDSSACERGCVCQPAYRYCIRAGQGWVENKVYSDRLILSLHSSSFPLCSSFHQNNLW